MPKQIPNVTSGPSAIGPYSVATEANGFVFVSGQVAFKPGTTDRVEGDAAAEAEQVMENIGGILGDVDLGYADIVKTTIFLADIGDFSAVNEVYARFVGEEPPARSTFQVAALPAGFKVEIEVIAAR
ncbi:MAG TPA: Rid family detoxifying hydrolase [Acidimicrobiia bacterium]|nr:Rid family detoxifying hydrolase [Acidimicrobiia bacterium]